MISTADFRNGMVIVQDGALFEIIEFQHVKPGKGGAFVRTKLKNVITERVLEKTFRAGERMEDARLESITYQYLYTDGDLYHFMHKDTYEQIAVSADLVGDKRHWMKENEDISLVFHNGAVLNIAVPLHVNLAVTRSDPGVQGDRATGGTKPATLETGVTVYVPLFINTGDVVRIDTRTAQYITRV
ncbi:MAG TPA: elongation factor P [Candidatus Hydrogenedentes bacterium]|nr:elongation factor P [Candidatus Hydrogenedentota bacterium]